MRLFFDLVASLRKGDDVHGSQLSAVLGVGLGLERDLLPFLQRAETLCLDCGKVYKHIFAALIGRDKAVTFTVIEPFHSSVHKYYLLWRRCESNRPGKHKRLFRK